MANDKRKLTERDFLQRIIFIRLILDLFGVVFLHTVLAPNRWKSGNIYRKLLCLH